MKKHLSIVIFLLILAVLASGCATSNYSYREPTYDKELTLGTVLDSYTVDPALEERILSLDPENISEDDINDVLAKFTAPRIINLHGGVYPVHMVMVSFSKFLIFMGYPEEKIRSPKNGSYSYSCYEDSEKLAGIIAWYYEREGMRPLMIGHSQGGIQAVKVLHELAGNFNNQLSVWNPVTETEEQRESILDPFTGKERRVIGISAAYASAVGSGGIARLLPNQWSMTGRLRSIPDTVQEFTGFYINLDIIGGDVLGFGSVNKYEPNGQASVRNVKLPASYSHVFVPLTRHLAKTQEIRDWINNYAPQDAPELDRAFNSSSTNILWAADVWYSIKKHWTLEVQRLTRARRESAHGK